MKKIFFVLIVLIPLIGFSQSKKTIRVNKIESKTTKKTIAKDTVFVTYVQKYEEFDKNGKVILEIKYDNKGVLRKKNSYVYDSFGNLIEEMEYTKKSEKTVKTTYAYDSNGNCIEELTNDSGGNIIERREYTYDKNGLMQTAVEYKPNGKVKWEKQYSYTNR